MLVADAVILGGGLGKRFDDRSSFNEGSLPKQFQLLNGIPTWVHSLLALNKIENIRQFYITFPKAYLGLAQEQRKEFLKNFEKPIFIIAGGETRQDSSRLALQAIEDANGESLPHRVLIHDACRPFFSTYFLQQIVKYMADRSFGAWVPVTPSVETLKKVSRHQVEETIDRSLVMRVQTPQIFEFSVLKSLGEKKGVKNIKNNFTDDASLCEYYGIPVGIFEGDIRNIKLTYSFEKNTLEFLLKQKDTACDSALVMTSIV